MFTDSSNGRTYWIKGPGGEWYSYFMTWAQLRLGF